MPGRRSRIAPLLVLPLLLVAGACRGEPDRSALEQEELERELDLALSRDTGSANFGDTAVAPAVEPEPVAAAPEPTPSRPRTQPQPRPRPAEPSPTPAPEPRREEPTPRPVRMTVPIGTTIAVRMDETLSTKDSQPGQPFTATIADPIVGLDGTVLIPSGAKVRGRVTAVEKSDRVGETAVIKLAFESVSFDGRSYPLQATVVEANPERRTRTSTGEQAGKVAVGAAAGAVLGRILGKDTEGAIKGAVIGAAAGTAIAMGTADVDAVLPAGSRMVIRLDAPVEVEQTVH